jgi:cytochrome P450
MAIIVEKLRFSIGATHRLQRIFQHPLTFELSEESQRSWTIPSGTPTSVSVWHLHQDKNIFPDPRAFKPECWIETPDMMKY